MKIAHILRDVTGTCVTVAHCSIAGLIVSEVETVTAGEAVRQEGTEVRSCDTAETYGSLARIASSVE